MPHTNTKDTLLPGPAHHNSLGGTVSVQKEAVAQLGLDVCVAVNM